MRLKIALVNLSFEVIDLRLEVECREGNTWQFMKKSHHHNFILLKTRKEIYLKIKTFSTLKSVHIWPHCVIVIGSFGLLLDPIGTFSIFLTISMPSITRPKTTCLLSRKLHLAHVTKNWQPFVCWPEFAIDKSPAASCLRLKFSSLNAPLP